MDRFQAFLTILEFNEANPTRVTPNCQLEHFLFRRVVQNGERRGSGWRLIIVADNNNKERIWFYFPPQSLCFLHDYSIRASTVLCFRL